MYYKQECSNIANKLYKLSEKRDKQVEILMNDYKTAIRYFKYQVFYVFVYIYIFTGMDKELQKILIQETNDPTNRTLIKIFSNILSTIICISFQVSKFDRKSSLKTNNVIFLSDFIYTNSFMYYYHYVHILHKKCSFQYKYVCYYFENMYFIFLALDLLGALFYWYVAVTQITLLEKENLSYQLGEKYLIDCLISRTREEKNSVKKRKMERLKRQLA